SLPTLDDALAALRLLPDTAESRELAAFARERGADVSTAARAIVDAAEIHAASALLRHAVRRNVDPGTLTLIGMGGLGSLLATGVAERLGMTRIAFPPVPAVGGALGLLASSAVFEADETLN